MINAEANDKAATVAAHVAHVTPEKTPSKKDATQKKGVRRSATGRKDAKVKAAAPKNEAKAGKKAAKPERKATSPQAKSKGGKILEMIGRAKGATLAEIMKATDWQAHSVRGFISVAAKKHGIKIESTKNEAGDRVYRTGK